MLKFGHNVDGYLREIRQLGTGPRHSFDETKLDGRHLGRDLPRTTLGEVSDGFQERSAAWKAKFARCNEVKLLIFDGSSQKVDFLDWIDTLEDYFQATNPPDAVKCKLATSKLKGDARTWWNELQNTRFYEGKNIIVSWSRMSDLLHERFLNTSRLTWWYKQENEVDEKPSNCLLKVPIESYSSNHRPVQANLSEHKVIDAETLMEKLQLESLEELSTSTLKCTTSKKIGSDERCDESDVKHTDNSTTSLLLAHSNCSLEEVKGRNIGGVECSQGDVCNEPDNMPTREVIISEIKVKHEEEKEEMSQEIEGQVLPMGEGKKDDGVIHENDIGGSIKEDDLSKAITGMDMLKYALMKNISVKGQEPQAKQLHMLKYALMKNISVKGQEPQAKHGIHSNHWSNTSRIGNGIGAKVQRVEKEQNRKQARWSPNSAGIIVDEMLTFSFDPGGVTKRGDAFSLLISKAAIADLSSNEALKKKMIVTHDMEAILKLIRHMNLINGEYSAYTNAIFKFATILFDPGGVLCPAQTTSLSNDFKADHAMPKLCDWNFDMVKGILVGSMVNDGFGISGLIKIEAKVVELAHVAEFRDQMKQEWVNAIQGPKWLVCYVMATLESNTTHVTVGQGQTGLVIIMEHNQCDMLGTKMESLALKLICKHTYCLCVTIPMDRSVTTGVDAYLTPFLKRYLYELVSKLHSKLVLRYPHIMVKAEIAMRIVLCWFSWLANRHDGLVYFMVVNLLNSQAKINVRTLNEFSFSCSVDTRVTRLYFSQWYTCRGGVWLTKCVAIIFLRSLNEFSTNIKQLNRVVLLPLSHTSGIHITFAEVPFFVCSLHLNRVIYEHFGQPLVIVESMYYVQVSVDGSSHVLSTFDIETPDRKVFIHIRKRCTVLQTGFRFIELCNFETISIYSKSCIGFKDSALILEFLMLQIPVMHMVYTFDPGGSPYSHRSCGLYMLFSHDASITIDPNEDLHPFCAVYTPFLYETYGQEMCGSTLWRLITRVVLGVVIFLGVENIAYRNGSDVSMERLRNTVKMAHPGEINFSLMIMPVNDKPVEGSMYCSFSGKHINAAHMKHTNEAFRFLDIDVESVQYLKGDRRKEILPPICEKKAERASKSCDTTGPSWALEQRIKIYSKMFGVDWQYNLRRDIGIDLAREGALLWEGWNDRNDENNANTQDMFIRAKIGVVTLSIWLSILSKGGHLRKTLRLFFKTVNGLDPPTHMKVKMDGFNMDSFNVARGRAFLNRGME